MTVRVDFVRVSHLPSPARASVIVRHCLLRRRVLGLVRVKSIAVLVLGAAYLSRSSSGIDLKHCIRGPVNIGIYPHTEEMLVVVGVNARIDLGAPPFCVFAGVHRVCVEDAGKLDLKLHGTILVEDPIDTVLIVRCSEDVRYQQFAASSDNDGIIPEIGMFEKNTRIFFVYADCILDCLTGSCSIDEMCIHVVDCSFTVTAQGKAVCHVPTTVLAQVERVLPVMRMFGITVRNHHLGQGKSVEDAPLIAFVVIGNIVQNYTFAVIEADVYLPILPFNDASVDLERHTFWLSDIDRLQILAVSSISFYGCRMIVVGWRLIDRSSDMGNVDVGDFLGVGVEDGREVEGERVLAVIDVRSVVH